MARKVGRLSPAQVEKEARAGMHCDGGGLYLLVSEAGTRSWIFRFMLRGKPREMGLGPTRLIGLKEARRRAIEAGRLLLDGVDPIEARRAARTAAKLQEARTITFQQAAERYIAANAPGWRNEKHAAQWTATLTTYVFPVVGKLPVASVDVGLVTKILQPIWATKPETASRVRGRIESVLDYAATSGWRDGENPARWRGHLEHVLPKRAKVAAVEHHAALDWREIAGFMRELEAQPGVSALALRFTVLTAARTNETIGATWSEIDLQSAVWEIPASRMKAGKPHRVPLSDAASAVLREASRLRENGDDGFIFPGGKQGKPLSNMAMAVLLRRMNRENITVHGMRSCFRDWAGETGQAADLAEAALAHSVGNKTIAAYARGDLLDRRRRLMDAWASWCARPAPASDNVVQLSAIGAVAHA